jgi:hypothetical protein
MRRRPRRVEPGDLRSASSQAARVSGRWKPKTGRLRASGSRRFVKRVSTPVHWQQKGSGRRGAGRLSGRPWLYLPDWISTSTRGTPAFFASITPAA